MSDQRSRSLSPFLAHAAAKLVTLHVLAMQTACRQGFLTLVLAWSNPPASWCAVEGGMQMESRLLVLRLVVLGIALFCLAAIAGAPDVVPAVVPF